MGVSVPTPKGRTPQHLQKKCRFLRVLKVYSVSSASPARSESALGSPPRARSGSAADGAVAAIRVLREIEFHFEPDRSAMAAAVVRLEHGWIREAKVVGPNVRHDRRRKGREAIFAAFARRRSGVSLARHWLRGAKFLADPDTSVVVGTGHREPSGQVHAERPEVVFAITLCVGPGVCFNELKTLSLQLPARSIEQRCGDPLAPKPRCHHEAEDCADPFCMRNGLFFDAWSSVRGAALHHATTLPAW